MERAMKPYKVPKKKKLKPYSAAWYREERRKERSEELRATINHLAEMDAKGTPVDPSKPYRVIMKTRILEVHPGGWVTYDYDPNNPKQLEYLKNRPFAFTIRKYKPPTQEEIRARELKEFEELCEYLGIEFSN
ncbi:hypothetical protein [Chitinophaga sp.]|uniref:hypothetical protein n=1 Tax=Chitinophaga sp. TaxID=1869181 RepID=UPI0031DFBF86